MNKIILILIIASKMNAQVMWQLKNDSFTKWYYQDGDEFNAFTLNDEKWKLGLPWSNLVMSQDLYFANENVELKDGKIIFVARKEKKRIAIRPDEIDNKYLEKSGRKVTDNMYEVDYTAGLITSQKRYKYGYFEIRFKSNAEKGTWPAFWLYGGNPNEEIDFFELKGEKDNQLHIDVHCPKGCDDFHGGFLNLKKNWGSWIKTSESLSSDWNIISGEWQPSFVKFFLNGQPIAYFKGEFKTAQNVIINTSVAKDGGAFNPGPDDKTKWPNTFLVDYVRIWSQKDTISEVKDNYKLFEYTPHSIEKTNLYHTQLKRKVNYVYDNKALKNELGSITLLPILYNKYSLSILGKNLGKIQVDILDRFDVKVAGFGLVNMEYYIMDLSALPTGPYQVKIQLLNQILLQNIPIINPSKVGEQ